MFQRFSNSVSLFFSETPGEIIQNNRPIALLKDQLKKGRDPNSEEGKSHRSHKAYVENYSTRAYQCRMLIEQCDQNEQSEPLETDTLLKKTL